MVWVKNMDQDEMNQCKKQLDDILIPLQFAPYTIRIENSPDDSDF